jgi:hypothetical protein
MGGKLTLGRGLFCILHQSGLESGRINHMHSRGRANRDVEVSGDAAVMRLIAGDGCLNLPTQASAHRLFLIDLVSLAVEIFGEVTKLPLGLWVSGAVGNIATFVGAFAECFRV